MNRCLQKFKVSQKLIKDGNKKGEKEMTIRECYEQMGENYEDIFARFGNDAMIEKYLVKYWEKKELESLKQALEQEQYAEAYTCAHNMKGVGLNLSLQGLSDAGTKLCEAMKKEASKEELSELFEEVKAAYEKMEKAVSQLRA